MSLIINVSEIEDDAWSVVLVEQNDSEEVAIELKVFEPGRASTRKDRVYTRDRAADWGRRAAKSLGIACHVDPLNKREKSADDSAVGP